MKDALGDRMKGYENITRYHLMPRGYTFLRIDGKAFHSYLKGCNRPFDDKVISDMNDTALYLCENVQNAKMAYVQSDEITLLLCDFEKLTTDQFFDGNVQKISSVVASMATAKFNQLRMLRNRPLKCPPLDGSNRPLLSEVPLAMFDCRCWTVPNAVEAMNVFRWRQQDCVRNSISMVAQSNFSHKELHGKSQSDMHEMLHTKGVNWATDFTDGEKNGRFIHKEEQEREGIFFVKNRAEGQTLPCNRKHWVANGAWVFTKDEGRLATYIPKYE
jgi:tRNA(His) guanylyltransferase